MMKESDCIMSKIYLGNFRGPQGLTGGGVQKEIKVILDQLVQ